MRLAVFLFLATIVATRSADCHLLRLHSGAAGHQLDGLNCLSWRFAVETNNIRDFGQVPMTCLNYIASYILGKQYRYDCEMVVDTAIDYAKSLNLGGDGKGIWILDIDETTLSNMPYYINPDVMFGTKPYNSTLFNEWIAEASAPAVSGSLRLYNTLLDLGFKIVFLTGSKEKVRQARITNLKKVGFHTWEKLILMGESDKGTTQEFKSKKRTELVKAGYRILGNSGDQWSDLTGPNAGKRTFKVPDPLYYVD